MRIPLVIRVCKKNITKGRWRYCGKMYRRFWIFYNIFLGAIFPKWPDPQEEQPGYRSDSFISRGGTSSAPADTNIFATAFHLHCTKAFAQHKCTCAAKMNSRRANARALCTWICAARIQSQFMLRQCNVECICVLTRINNANAFALNECDVNAFAQTIDANAFFVVLMRKRFAFWKFQTQMPIALALCAMQMQNVL